MADWYIYAKDWSGSTIGCTYYHTNGLSTYYQFKEYVDTVKTPKKVVYLHWSSKCIQVDGSKIVSDYKQNTGRGVTKPQTIIQWIKQNIENGDKIKLLYIITDGCIHQLDVHQCEYENNDMIYEKIVFHAFNKNEELDISVAAPFLTAQCELYSNNELMGDTDISKDYDYDSININNFECELQNLISFIRLQFISIASYHNKALDEIEKLKELRRRLLREAEFHGKSTVSMNEWSTKDKKLLIAQLKMTKFYKNLTTAGELDAAIHIEKTITTLINYINTTERSYEFNLLKCQRDYSQDEIDEVNIDENITFKSHERIEFPDIIYCESDGVPVILLARANLISSIIFKNTENDSKSNFANFSRLMSCPLFFLLNKELNESIEYFYTFDVYVKLRQMPWKIGPHTRKPFAGGIVLSEEFDDYNDYILAVTYFQSSIVKYNRGLFYYVLYKICQSKEWMDPKVLEKLKEYVYRRIEKTICPLALSSLPLDPKINVPLTTALWYCIELSSELFMNDVNNFTNERIRMLHPVIKYIKEILQYFNYDLNLELIEMRCEIFKNISTFKRIFPQKELMYHIAKRIFAVDSNDFLLAKIENPENIRLLNYLKLNHRKMIKTDDVICNVNLNDYVYLMYSRENAVTVEYSEETMRPYFINSDHSFYVDIMNSYVEIKINDNNELYTEKLTKLDLKKVLSMCKLYIEYVRGEKKYPTLPEYMSYIHKTKKFKKNFVRLFPLNVSERIQYIFESYQRFAEKFPVDYFIKRASASINRVRRIKAERRNELPECIKLEKSNLHLDDDNEIEKFISDEEQKVNLTK